MSYTTWLAGTRIVVLYHEGAWDEANALGESYVPEGPVSQGNPALSRCILATIARDRGDPDVAQAHLALVAPGVTSSTDRQQESLIDHREFLLAEMEGRLDDLFGIAERWIDALLELGSDEAAAQVVGMTLDAIADAEGKDAAVSRLVETIDARSTSRRTPALEAELDRVKGTLASRQGDHDAAVEAFEQALGRSRAAGRARLLASVLADYGAALLRAGRTTRPPRCSTRRGSCTSRWEPPHVSGGLRSSGPDCRPDRRQAAATARSWPARTSRRNCPV